MQNLYNLYLKNVIMVIMWNKCGGVLNLAWWLINMHL